MTTKLDKKIIAWKVITEDNQTVILEKPLEVPIENYDIMHEGMKRPDVLLGSTYKIKTPSSDHALYITINDVILNQDTKYEERRPYEIFINSKNMEHYQWIVALTLVISAVFRKGGDVTFLVEELKQVFAPNGGYFKKGRYIHSLVSEIGDTIETHLKLIGMIKVEIDEHQKAYIEIKKAEFIKKGSNFLPCPKCQQQTAALMDGCMTCTDPNCSYSKCG